MCVCVCVVWNEIRGNEEEEGSLNMFCFIRMQMILLPKKENLKIKRSDVVRKSRHSLFNASTIFGNKIICILMTLDL